MELKRPGILLLNLLIMLGYSVLFIALGEVMRDEVIGIHWPVLIAHILVLFIWAIVKLTNEATKKVGKQMLLSSLLVAIIGHGLCFFNGLLHMGNVH